MFVLGSLKDFAHAPRLLAKPFFPARSMTEGKYVHGYVS